MAVDFSNYKSNTMEVINIQIVIASQANNICQYKNTEY